MSFQTEKIPGTPIYKARCMQAAQGVITLADLNAGLIVVPGLESRITQLLGFRFRMNGTFAGLTDMRLQTTEAVPTDLVTIVAAQMGDTIVHTETFGTNVKAAAFWLPLARGANLKVVKTGAAATGGTSIDYVISYLFDA